MVVAGKARGWLSLLVWSGSLAAGLVLFHGIGGGPLAAPPPDPASWAAWIVERDVLVATAASLRLVVLAFTWYLVGATVVGLVARLARSVRAVRLADALTVPALRRLLQTSLGLSLATGVVVAALPAGVAVAAPPATVGASESDAPPDLAPGIVAGPDAARAVGDAGPPPLRLLHQRSVGTSGPDLEVVPEASATDTPAPPPLRRLDVAGDASAPRPGAPGDASEPREVVVDDPSLPVPPPSPAPVGREVVLRHLGPTSSPTAGQRQLEDPADPHAEHVVVAGESLWTIAHDVVTRELGRPPTDAEVARYWLELVEVQRPFLADPDDPDLIFPGERVRLPATSGGWHG
jgi:hypothetical protein